MKFTRDVIPIETLQRLDANEAATISGEIKVSNYFKDNERNVEGAGQ